MNRLIPVYRYGEAECFMKIPFGTFAVLNRGDILSVPGDDGVGIQAYTVVLKEVYIEDGEPIYSLQVEEWCA